MNYKTCWSIRIGFYIALEQAGPDDFCVRYGRQIDEGLSYSQAASKLGQAIMHALSCDALVDNREKGE